MSNLKGEPPQNYQPEAASDHEQYSVLASSNQSYANMPPRNMQNEFAETGTGRAPVRAPVNQVANEAIRAQVRPHGERASRPALEVQRPGTRRVNIFFKFRFLPHLLKGVAAMWRIGTFFRSDF
jgi:hypothetical protein